MSEQQVAAIKELINTVGEVVISLVVIIGAGEVLLSPAAAPDVHILAGSAITLVLGVWFTQRGTAKAQNGTLAAMSDLNSKLAAQLNQSNANTAAIVSQAINQNQTGGTKSGN